MDSPIFLQWQQWESRVRDWLDQADNEFILTDTTSIDRLILTVLAVKYQVLYKDLDKEAKSADAKEDSERTSTIQLSKNKAPDVDEAQERPRDKEKMFDTITGRFLSPEQASNETSPEWQEFNQLYDWHGVVFLQRFVFVIRRLISEVLGSTPAYRELMNNPPTKSVTATIANQVYTVQNDGGFFISVDMKSANFSMLQYIGAIDAQIYPTYADLLAVFVGSRPLFTQSKKLRQRILGTLPEYRKLEALWTHYTTDVYRKILCRCLDENEIDARCVSLAGDEVVFQLNASVKTDEASHLVQSMQSSLDKESPMVKFVVQAYRLQVFHWRNQHRCFARIFIGDSDKFDLKCVPQKDKNYDRAYEDFRTFAGL